MAGHSKWANIKRKKEANDKVKGYIFAKLSRLITLSVQESGGITNPEANFKLRLAIDKARSYNMPKENIHRAVEKGIKDGQGGLKEVVYEVYAPFGVVIVIQCATDNPTRTVHELRSRIENRGGKIGTQGSALYLFQKCGLIEFQRGQISDEILLTIVDKLKALDIVEEGESTYIYIPFDQFGKISEALKGQEVSLVEVVYRPINAIILQEDNQIKQIQHIIEEIEEFEDVQSVFTNVQNL